MKIGNYKNNKNSGATMIVCIIIMAILMTFTFSLAIVSYTLYSSQNKNIASKKCSEAANTLSVAIDEELTSSNAYKNSYLWRYIRCNILQESTWPFYASELSGDDHNETAAYRYFNMKYTEADVVKSVEGAPSKTSVCIYWELPEDYEASTYEQSGNINGLTGEEKEGTRLFVEITCEAGSQSYTIVNEYTLKAVTLVDDSSDEVSNYINEMTSLQDDHAQFNPCENNIATNEKWEWELVSRE